MHYEWDPDKADANLFKHGIDFADAVGVFEDPFALTQEDPHSYAESRFLTLGLDSLGRLVVVVYTHRNHRIRLISARKATTKERKTYERHRP